MRLEREAVLSAFVYVGQAAWSIFFLLGLWFLELRRLCEKYNVAQFHFVLKMGSDFWGLSKTSVCFAFWCCHLNPVDFSHAATSYYLDCFVFWRMLRRRGIPASRAWARVVDETLIVKDMYAVFIVHVHTSII